MYNGTVHGVRRAGTPHNPWSPANVAVHHYVLSTLFSVDPVLFFAMPEDGHGAIAEEQYRGNIWTRRQEDGRGTATDATVACGCCWHNLDGQMFCERPDGKTAPGHVDCAWPEDRLQDTTVVPSTSGRQS